MYLSTRVPDVVVVVCLLFFFVGLPALNDVLLAVYRLPTGLTKLCSMATLIQSGSLVFFNVFRIVPIPTGFIVFLLGFAVVTWLILMLTSFTEF